ncbi:MAG: NACHT domain-containing protein [Ignavibacteriae bacterium]|nr:NACHT domain-containing protein [Ignavibacteriota bacterium]
MSMTIHQKLKKLKEISDERKFHELLRDLFSNMGYQSVIITHGQSEAGKDLVFYEYAKIQEKVFIAVVAKIGDITGATTKREDASLTNISQQIRECFGIPHFDPETKQKVNIRTVFVVNNGNVSNTAREKIVALFGEKATDTLSNVDFIPVAKLTKLFNDHYPDFFLYGDSFVSRYFSKLKHRIEKLEEMQAFEYKGEVKRIDSIYIEPALRPAKDHNTRLTPVQVISTGNNLLLLGMSGSGKSTLIKHLVLERIEECSRSHGKFSSDRTKIADLKLPIYLKFRDLSSKKILTEVIEDELSLKDFTVPEFNLKNQLERGSFVVFIDGLDEVTEAIEKDKIVKIIKEFVNEFPMVQIILSSREIEYLAINPDLAIFKRYEILALDNVQVQKFVRKWFKGQKLDMQKMLKNLCDTVMMQKLPKTPMVLTLLSILVEQGERKELPSTLTELYSLATELFLKRWDIAKNITSLYEYRVKEDFLMELAYFFNTQKTEEISTIQLNEFVQGYLQNFHPDYFNPTFLSEIIERTQLIVCNEKNNFQFRHASFQDYFAAKAYKDIYANEKTIIEGFNDFFWEGVIFFYCGLKGKCPNIFKEIILNWKHDGILEQIRKVNLLGYISQSAFLNSYETKKESVAFGLDQWVTTLYNLIDNPPKDIAEAVKKIPEMEMASRFKSMFSSHYGSGVLAPVIEDLYNSIKIPIGHVEEKDLKSFKKIVIKKYFSAYCLAELNKPEYLLKFAEEVPRGDENLFLELQRDVRKLNEPTSFFIMDKKLKKKIEKEIKNKLATLRKAKQINYRKKHLTLN